MRTPAGTRVDLHTHSNASDGTETPAELVRAAADARVDVVALTDHDTLAGWAPAAAALPPGLTLVPGIELSCRSDGTSLHLLGYCPDPAHGGLVAALDRLRAGREGRARQMVERLAAAGWPVSWESLSAQRADGASVGRPHMADALVVAGAVADRAAAFAGPLSASSPCYVPYPSLDPVEGVRLLRSAGAAPVVAHVGASTRGALVGDDVVAAMAAAGMVGLEVDHPDHDAATRERLRSLAADLGLVVTGSSDHHGTGKTTRVGQEGLTAPSALEALLEVATGTGVVVG